MADEEEGVNIASLPTDIILTIIQYLSPLELLSFCNAIRIFQYDPEIRFSAPFWRTAIRNTFRVPNQPAVAGDGRRWMKLYRKMRTQTKIYGWGQNDGHCFGHQAEVIYQDSVRPIIPVHAVAGVRPLNNTRRIVPKNSVEPVELNRGGATVVADLQCGGWSTTVLDASGMLYTSGSLESANPWYRPGSQSPTPAKLIFPPGYYPRSQNDSEHYRYDPYTAIKQFSSGRSHVLGLSDSGRIWSWDAIAQPGVHVKFLTIDLIESETTDISRMKGAVRRVVAGWDRSTAYVVGTGIITWTPSNIAELEGAADRSSIDGMLVLEPKVVPDSAYLRRPRDERAEDASVLDHANVIGEVTNHIALRNYIVFVTHLGKVFASRMDSEGENPEQRTIQIMPVSTESGPASPETFAIDVQGSLLHFAIFKRNGEILIGDADYLEKFWIPLPAHLRDAPRPWLRKIPCLQHTGVISMAFGDWHYHALHADGSISSYGHDPTACGALGIGPRGNDTNLLRGLKLLGNGDRDFLPQSFTTGRRIAFEEEKRTWLQHLWEDDSPGAKERKAMCLQHEDVRAEISEWVEQRLNTWGQAHGLQTGAVEEDADDLPAYFALSVAAAGWHSGALVLVDDAKAQAVRHQLRVPRPSLPLPPLDAHKPSDSGDEGSEGHIAESEQQDVVSPPSEAPAAPGLVNRITDAISAGVRSFLGLPTVADWAWAHERFPRLSLRSGEIMPGDGPVVDWTGPSEWKEVEWVEE